MSLQCIFSFLCFLGGGGWLFSCLCKVNRVHLGSAFCLGMMNTLLVSARLDAGWMGQ